jgi:hypothetical protein
MQKNHIVITSLIALLILLIGLGIYFRKNIQKQFLTRDQIAQYCTKYKDHDSCQSDPWCQALEVSCPNDIDCTGKFTCYAK